MSNTNLQNESSAGNNVTPETPLHNSGNKLTWSYSGKAMRARFILYLLLSLLAIGGIGYAQFAQSIPDYLLTYFWIGAAVFVGLLWLNFYVTYFYRVWTIKYELEGHCLYSYTGLFTQKRDTLELMYINDLQLVRTLFDIIFNGGVGKLIIFSATDKTDGKLVITGVENPHYILDKIDKTRLILREKRGFISGDNS
ncbi:MAG: hypothetical protein LBT09_06135 [Planctomycetaceae bacterium]|nr:hypothetical protein [Planctomycetaceae bacterium]